MLSYWPAPVGVTSTTTVQIVFAKSAPPMIPTLEPPGVAVRVAPRQSVPALLGEAICRPAGNTSVKLAPRAFPAFALLSSVRVRVDRPPA